MRRNTAFALLYLFTTLALVLSATLARAQSSPATRRTVPPAPSECNDATTAGEIMARLVRAWRGDAEMKIAQPLTLGARIAGEGGGEYTVSIVDGVASLSSDGIRSDVNATISTDIGTLRRIDRGEISAMTAMARARATDPAPMSVSFPKDFRWTPAGQALYLPFTFHFFNRGVPEVVRFGDGTSREVHGANSAILYYDRGLRTSWYQLEPGMHINRDAKDQTNPFSSLVIVTRGEMESRIGGHARTLREGEAVLVPEAVAHEFWTTDRGYAEFILVMFGDKA